MAEAIWISTLAQVRKVTRGLRPSLSRMAAAAFGSECATFMSAQTAASCTPSSEELIRSISIGMPSCRRTAIAAAGMREIFSIARAALSCTSSEDEVSSGSTAFTTLSSCSACRAVGTCSHPWKIKPHKRT